MKVEVLTHDTIMNRYVVDISEEDYLRLTSLEAGLDSISKSKKAEEKLRKKLTEEKIVHKNRLINEIVQIEIL